MTTTAQEQPTGARRVSRAVAPRSWRRLAIAAALAVAVTVVTAKTGGWWIVGAPGFSGNLDVARILLFLLLLGGAYWVPALVRRSSTTARVVFAGWTAYLTAWIVALWPGILMTDSVDVVFNSRRGVVYEWFSSLYSLLNIAILDVVPHVAALGAVHILLTAGTFAYASSLLARRGAGTAPLVAVNLLAAISAPVVVTSLLYSRDTLFGLLHVLLALYVADAVAVRRSLSRGGLVAVAGLTGALSVLRGDGLALLIVVPLVLLLLRPGRRAALAGAGAFAAAALAFHVVLPATVTIDPKVPNAYELSLRTNQLGAVLNTDFYSETSEQDLATLGRVIDVEAFKALSTPVEIPAYWEGRWNRQATDADFAAFTRVADRLLRDNAGTVLDNRVRTFGATSGLAPGAFTGAPAGAAAERHDWIAEPAGMTGSPPWPGLYERLASVLRESSAYRGVASYRSALQWNLVPWLVLLAAVLLAYRRLRFEALFALIVLSRVPLVFLAAPAAQFKYYYSVLLAGILLAGFLLARLRTHLSRRPSAARAPVRPAWR